MAEFVYPNQQQHQSRPRKNDEREANQELDIPDVLLSLKLFPDLG